MKNSEKNRELFNDLRSLLANVKVDIFMKKTEAFYKNEDFGIDFRRTSIKLHQASIAGDYEMQSILNIECLINLSELLKIPYGTWNK